MKSPFRLSRRLPFGLVAPFIESFTGLKTLDKLYIQNYKPTNNPAEFAQQALEILGVHYVVQQGNIQQIPKKGPVIVIANHPFGGIEGLVLIDLIIKHRPDIKVLTNQELDAFSEFNDIFIGVNLIGKSSQRMKNWLALDAAKQWVNSDGALLLFPSGEVASWQWKYRQVIEAPWQKTVARLIKTTNASVVPVFFEGKNSPIFHSLGLIHKRMRTLWLARELINKQGKQISLRIGDTIHPHEMASLKDKESLTNYLRLNTLLLGCRQKVDNDLSNHSKTKFSVAPMDKKSLDRAQICNDLDQLSHEHLLIEKGDMQVWCAASANIPNILLEIGRLREITFRSVGEGSGKTIDLDEFDHYYQHLFLWDNAQKEIVGAYRIGHVDQILTQKGLHALYSQRLFGYNQKFLDKLFPCLEMGRSFIVQKYQKNISSLLLLWKGIGAYIGKNPHYRTLFGPVSISSEYNEISRQLIASCMTINNFDHQLASMTNPIKPYKLKQKVPWTLENLSAINQTELLSSLVKVIEGDKGIPILIKQYLKLQGEFAGFNLDDDFANALDGLIIVDILKVDERTLTKYMGAEQAKKYRLYHEHVNDSVTKKKRISA